MTGHSPKVSCITTTYKRPKELERAIKSVNAQTYKDWEHIVVHDGPAGKKTKEIMEKYAQPNRKFIELETNHTNHTKPKNVGILASKGEYICYLDDDNEYLPTFMEVLKLELELSAVDGVYGLERMFADEKDTRGQETISFPFDPQLLIHRSYIDTNSILHKRDAVFKVGGWDETLPRFADWNLFLRMAKAGMTFKQVPIFLIRYYHNTDKNSSTRYPVKSWIDPESGITMFDPTWFSPAGCYIWGPWLGTEEPKPKVAIFSLVYDRHEYAEKTLDSIASSTEYPYEHVVVAQSDEDADFVREYAKKNNIEIEEYDGV
jgi:glycosyltransferase involved in cell wall biosynthesis